jgi:hypothetical protein
MHGAPATHTPAEMERNRFVSVVTLLSADGTTVQLGYYQYHHHVFVLSSQQGHEKQQLKSAAK